MLTLLNRLKTLKITPAPVIIMAIATYFAADGAIRSDKVAVIDGLIATALAIIAAQELIKANSMPRKRRGLKRSIAFALTGTLCAISGLMSHWYMIALPTAAICFVASWAYFYHWRRSATNAATEV